jgi:hypothetical protein
MCSNLRGLPGSKSGPEIFGASACLLDAVQFDSMQIEFQLNTKSLSSCKIIKKLINSKNQMRALFTAT